METNEFGFYAYASEPAQIGQTIEQAVIATKTATRMKVLTWKSIDIPGQFISSKVLESIESCAFLIADISVLNFNVTYEIGYAIGKQKRVLLTKNKSIRELSPTIREVGIFDTLGYREYQNSEELSEFIKSSNNLSNLNIQNKINIKSPYPLSVRK